MTDSSVGQCTYIDRSKKGKKKIQSSFKWSFLSVHVKFQPKIITRLKKNPITIENVSICVGFHISSVSVSLPLTLLFPPPQTLFQQFLFQPQWWNFNFQFEMELLSFPWILTVNGSMWFKTLKLTEFLTHSLSPPNLTTFCLSVCLFVAFDLYPLVYHLP